MIVENMPEKWKPMVLLASWCALCYGEIAELRRKDCCQEVDAMGTLTIRHASSRGLELRLPLSSNGVDASGRLLPWAST